VSAQNASTWPGDGDTTVGVDAALGVEVMVTCALHDWLR
jgi:hypothetical protein